MVRCLNTPCSGVKRSFVAATAACVLSAGLYVGGSGTAEAAVSCPQTITANVVVLDNPTVFNRLGAQNPNWITYALKRDVVVMNPDGTPGAVCTDPGVNCSPGNVMLRPDKRPRPLVVRSVAGACLNVTFTNLLDPIPNPNPAQQGQNTPGTLPNGQPFPGLFNDNQVADRCASFHAQGVELVGTMDSDGSFVGVNDTAADIDACGPNAKKSGVVGPGGTITYNLYTPKEGTFTVNSYGATIGSEANGGNLGLGMFAQLNVEPVGARIYRSQVTEEEMRLATIETTEFGQPIINYEAVYPSGEPWASEGKAGLPVLNMLTPAGELVHSDINAIIAGPNPDGSFPPSTYPLESVNKNVPSLPNRLEAFREFASIFHDEQTNSQVYPNWYQDPVLGYTLHGVGDVFMINYGSGGIGSEIISNRLHTGPMHDCTDCAYEEFFLASQTVGDPGLLVNFPANTNIEACSPRNIAAGPGEQNACWRLPGLANGPIPNNFALYQEDPYNVHHAYTGDQVKMRNIHAGAFEQHIFHLHNHQWLFNPNDDNGNYLDAQEIMPGSGHTYELANGGAGNRNKTVGDAIFHCHFYPHFAQGMWYHLRNLDTLQTGSVLAVSVNDDANGDGFHDTAFALRNGQPAAGTRALPDGELPDGVPIPAVVPLPGKAMPHMPAKVSIAAVDRGAWTLLGGRLPPDGIPDSSQAVVDHAEALGPDGIAGTEDDVSPGFPFWVAGNECGVPTATNPCPHGTVGQRAPTPPLDMLTEAGASAAGFNAAQAGGWDGGLPRHNLLGYTSGGLSLDTQNRLDFSKVIERAQPVYFPETGTDIEKVSMAYQAVRERPSAATNLAGVTTAASFVLNGADPVPGGPFQDPCIDDRGIPLTAGVVGEFFDGDNDQATLTTRGASTFTSENPRTYKLANVQIDAVFNKVGYHYPQERIISLWEDVAPTVLKQRPPEPLVMRFNTFDCGKILHANLVPGEFEVDDFQVRTPTDIIGQHIHLPKWDLTTDDGAANGWNYEDGTLAPAIVIERIHAINEFNEQAADPVAHPELADLNPVATLPNPCGDDGTPLCGTEGGLTHLDDTVEHPFFGGIANNPQTPLYVGARTTIQRILVDPVVNVAGVDRGLGLTFSHDHYGPSTFQQIGLYSTILAEPAGSTWVHNEKGFAEVLGTRHDGGPTTWQAAILPPAAAPLGSTVGSENIPDHREFYFEMSDFQHAYEAGVFVGANGFGIPQHTEVNQPDPFNAAIATAPAIQDTWRFAVNPPLKVRAFVQDAQGNPVGGAFPDVVKAEPVCPGGQPRPCSEAINIAHGSMFVVNYRNEPVGLRVFDPNRRGPDRVQGAQAAGLAGDLAFAFQTRTDRAIPQLNTSFGDMPYPTQGNCDGINCDRQAGDPITPIMRAYQRDEVKIKIQVGATEEQHQSTIHGLKWLSNGSGFGRSPNSGWRNFQSHGISEQFSLQAPVNPDLGQAGQRAFDTLYATDATRDGIWTGSWGILRTYGFAQNDLFQLPNNAVANLPNVDTVINENEFVGVCPAANPQAPPGQRVPANLVTYDVTAVLANNVLPNNLGVTIPPNAPAPGQGGDSDGDGIGDNEGAPLNTAGGTLVYNRRGTVINNVVVPAAGNEPGFVAQGGAGPLNDPTAILYVRTADLVPNPQNGGQRNQCNNGGATNPACPVRLADNAPVEPLVLRANAGQCIQVTLRNRLPAVAPDLAGWQDMLWVVNRELFQPVRGNEMHFFNNNLIRPSSYVGLHPQLVEYDITRADGTLVGNNLVANGQLAPPGGVTTYRWYAGDIDYVPEGGQYRIVATPIEFGGTNLLSADRVKQPQKGLFGALVIEPAGATVTANTQVPDGQGSGAATRLTRAQVSVTSPAGGAGSGGNYREALAIGHKITNLRWANGRAIANVNQNELGREGAEDAGHAGFNYGMEPSWFRFMLPPDVPFGNAQQLNTYGAIPNAHAMYANNLVVGEPNTIPEIAGVSALGDPVTPVFRTTLDADTAFDTRMHVLNGASADRDGTFMLHGHVWQRDPFVCPNQSDLGLAGRCNPNELVPSRALGLNQQAKYLGGEEGMGHVYGHWPILFDAGGADGVPGDYLYRDYAPNGNRNGQFGILRVQ